MKNKKFFSTYDIVVVGLMAALIFVVTLFLRIPIPMPTGTPTALKLANVLCLLAGLLFGGVRGGLAAGIGSALYDLTNPVYIADAPITFVNFFLMAFVCGVIAHAAGKKSGGAARSWGASVAGAVTYFVLYISKSIVVLVLEGSVLSAAVAACIPKMWASGFNGTVAVICSVLLAPIIRKALVRAGLEQKLFPAFR